MNSSNSVNHDIKLDSLVERYIEQGFYVVKEPSAELIPFDLNGYKPDLLATKGDKNLIIEVKTTASRISIDKFQLISQEISRHSGWRFLLVTLDDIESSKIPDDDSELFSWADIDSKLVQVESLMIDGLYEPAILYLWSIFEAALRKQAIAQRIPVERLPAHMLLKHMYSQGEVSVEVYKTFLDFMKIRNHLAHGGNPQTQAPHLNIFFKSVVDIVNEWQGKIIYN